MTDEPYTPLAEQEPIARLCTAILVKVLEERERDDLLAEYDAHGGRIEDDPETGGLALYVGSELVTRVLPDAIALGLQMQPSFDNREN